MSNSRLTDNGCRNRISIGAVLIFAMAFGCAGAWAAEKDKSNPGDVVATVGTHKITQRDLDKEMKVELDKMHQDLERQAAEILAKRAEDPELKRKLLEQMADDYLVKHAAKQANQTVPQYLKAQSSAGNGVTDEEVKALYDSNRQWQSIPFIQIKTQLKAMMGQEALVKRLRQDDPVKILIKGVVVNSGGHPAIGPANAPVTIVEFSDFQCPYCKAAEPTIKELVKKYGDKIRVVYMDYPLPFHSHSAQAAKAARCANDQNKFWEFHDALFENQAKLDPDSLKATAKRLNLDSANFEACLAKPDYDIAVKKDVAEASKLGVDGTPAFFINGRKISGAQKPPAFEEIIDEELANSGSNAQ
ncbi:MAG TPA: thioredoxin domain-containing protein [Candidatus Binataceae bacterium]|nr:thioredoxin domain-containing protein [Candidatus Binataceae bacterium]